MALKEREREREEGSILTCGGGGSGISDGREMKNDCMRSHWSFDKIPKLPNKKKVGRFKLKLNSKFTLAVTFTT